jgi:hypothetical protein
MIHRNCATPITPNYHTTIMATKLVALITTTTYITTNIPVTITTTYMAPLTDMYSKLQQYLI